MKSNEKVRSPMRRMDRSLAIAEIPSHPNFRGLHRKGQSPSRLVNAFTSFFLVLCIGFSLQATLRAQEVPNAMNFQGFLKEAGAPVTGERGMIFRIFNDEIFGTPLYEEDRRFTNRVPVEKGVFAVLIGTVTPLTPEVFSVSNRFLEVEVEGIKLPRQRLVTVPYAFRSAQADSLTPGSTIQINSVSVTTLHVDSLTVDVATFTGVVRAMGGLRVGEGTIELGGTAAGAPNTIRFTSPAGPPFGTIDTSRPAGDMDLRLNADTDGTIRLNPTSSGGVGIGLPNAPAFDPISRLHVRQDDTAVAGVTSVLTLDHTAGGAGGLAGIGTGLVLRTEDSSGVADDTARIDGVFADSTDGAEAGDLVLMTRTGGMGLTEKVRIDSLGNVGIGTLGAPQHRLDVRGGNIQIEGTTPILRLNRTSGGVAEIFNFQDSLMLKNGVGEELVQLRADNSSVILGPIPGQRVGVGTEFPSTRLDVEGDAQFGALPTKSSFTSSGSLRLANGAEVFGLPDVPTADNAAASKKYVDDTVVAGGGVPIGAIMDFAGLSAPAGWLLCNGQAVDRVGYSLLFAAIGTTYGAGDGVITFNVPDFRGRVSVGVGQGAGLTNRLLGESGGAESHTQVVSLATEGLYTDEVGDHAHGGNVGMWGPNPLRGFFLGESSDTTGFNGTKRIRTFRRRAVYQIAPTAVDTNTPAAYEATTVDGAHVHEIEPHNHPGSTVSPGSSMQPFISMNKIIKAQP